MDFGTQPDCNSQIVFSRGMSLIAARSAKRACGQVGYMYMGELQSHAAHYIVGQPASPPRREHERGDRFIQHTGPNGSDATDARRSAGRRFVRVS
jgi:hypothetical protein